MEPPSLDDEVADRSQALTAIEIRDVEEEELVQRVISAGHAYTARPACRGHASDGRNPIRTGDRVPELNGGLITRGAQRRRRRLAEHIEGEGAVDTADGASPSVSPADPAGSVPDPSPEHAPRPTTSARTTLLHPIARTATV